MTELTDADLLMAFDFIIGEGECRNPGGECSSCLLSVERNLRITRNDGTSICGGYTCIPLLIRYLKTEWIERGHKEKEGNKKKA